MNQTVSPNVVFNEAALEIANKADFDDEDAEAGTTAYRRYLIAHLWDLSQITCANLETKAWYVKLGQIFFGGFIVGFGTIAGAIAWNVLGKMP